MKKLFTYPFFILSIFISHLYGQPWHPHNILLESQVQEDRFALQNTDVRSCENVILIIDTVICDGGPFMGITGSGTYYDTVTIGGACDSITIIHVDFNGPVIVEIDTAICEGEFFAGYNTSGVYTYDSIDVVTGCASIVILTLEIIPLGMGSCISATNEPDQDDLMVYPNPARQEIYVSSSAEIESIRLMTREGKSVALGSIYPNAQSVTIFLDESIPSEVYILEVITSGKRQFRKLMKD